RTRWRRCRTRRVRRRIGRLGRGRRISLSGIGRLGGRCRIALPWIGRWRLRRKSTVRNVSRRTRRRSFAKDVELRRGWRRRQRTADNDYERGGADHESCVLVLAVGLGGWSWRLVLANGLATGLGSS